MHWTVRVYSRPFTPLRHSRSKPGQDLGNLIIDWVHLGISLLRSVQFCFQSVAVISDAKALSFSPFHKFSELCGCRRSWSWRKRVRSIVIKPSHSMETNTSRTDLNKANRAIFESEKEILCERGFLGSLILSYLRWNTWCRLPGTFCPHWQLCRVKAAVLDRGLRPPQSRHTAEPYCQLLTLYEFMFLFIGVSLLQEYVSCHSTRDCDEGLNAKSSTLTRCRICRRCFSPIMSNPLWIL